MMRNDLLFPEETFRRSYSMITEPVIACKTAFIGKCAEIDRFFRMTLDIDIRTELNEDQLSLVLHYYPSLSSLNLSQFNHLMQIFLLIRNDNAHLYANDPIYVNDAMALSLSSVVRPFFPITKGDELTLYGAFHVVALLSNMISVWPFVVNFFTSKILRLHVGSGKELNDFQIKVEKTFQEKCRRGKPTYSYPEGIGKNAINYMNLTLQTTLSKVFFGFEKDTLNLHYAKSDYVSFREVTDKASYLFDSVNDEEKLIELRNAWYHGFCLYDIYEQYGVRKTFTLDMMFSTLLLLQRACLKNRNRYWDVLKAMDDFAIAIMHFYCLRIVEVTYKIIDSRLTKKEKFESRIFNSWVAYKNMRDTIPGSLENAVSLYRSHDVKWTVKGSRFDDRKLRQTTCQILRVFLFNGGQDIQIGDLRTNGKNLCLADVDLPQEYQLKVNGFYLRELNGRPIENIGDRIVVYEVDCRNIH